MITYERQKKRRDDLRNYIRMFEGRKNLSLEEIFSSVQMETREEIDKEYIQNLGIDLRNKNQLYRKMFDVEN